ncbi:MAG: DUF559 domain-containing protein [Alistipes sp.]|nr:DUF559 domain-containing protein [Alistipes sp.]
MKTPLIAKIKNYNNSNQKELRRQLRNNATSAEASLWLLLKNRQLAGYKWRRQYSVGEFILDFYCPTCRLAIELDGQPHFSISGRENDFLRDKILLQKYGIQVLRFENNLIWQTPEGVIEFIEKHLKQEK